MHSVEVPDYVQNKISPNNGILFNGVLRPKLLNIPLAFCFLVNLDFLLPHPGHFLQLLVYETLGFILSVFLYTLNKMTLFYI